MLTDAHPVSKEIRKIAAIVRRVIWINFLTFLIKASTIKVP